MNIIYKNIKSDNMLSAGCSHERIYEADICQKVKNTEAETKKQTVYRGTTSFWARKIFLVSSFC